MAKATTELWSLGGVSISVEKDSEDEKILRIGELGPLDSSKTIFHFGGSESYDRELTGVMWNYSGYVNEFMPLIGSGYHTLISDIENEGNYFIVSCKPERLTDFIQCSGNSPVRMSIQLKKETTPPAPVWPGTVYFAGGSAIYRTDTFGASKTSDPTWTQLSNSGISGTFEYFALDPTDDTGEVWCKTNAGHIYKYSGSSWSIALNSADTGGKIIRGVYHDPVTGYIYAWTYTDGNSAHYDTYIDIHDGNGFVKHTSDKYFTGSYNWLRGIGEYSVYNNYHVLDYTSDLVGYLHRIDYSDNGTTWSTQTLSASANVDSTSWLDPVSLSYLYAKHSTSSAVYRADIGSSFSITDITENSWQYTRSRFMAYPENSAILRHITNDGSLYTTDDRFDTSTDNGQVDMGNNRRPSYMCQIVNTQDWDMIIYGGGSATISYPHVISTAYGNTDLSPTGKGGAMAGTSPYTNSIPYTVGRPIEGGIQFLNFTELN